MVLLSKDVIGKKVGSFKYTIEKSKIIEFCQAIGEKNPIYFDSNIAQESGFKDTPLPPTLQTCFIFWGYPTLWDDGKNFGIDVDRLLHLKQEYEYHKTIYPSTTISGHVVIDDVKTGKMDMVTLKIIIKDQEDDLCIESKMSIIIRPKED